MRKYPHVYKGNPHPLQTLNKNIVPFHETDQWVIAQYLNGTYFFYPKPPNPVNFWIKNIEDALLFKCWSPAEDALSEMKDNLQIGVYKVLRIVRDNGKLALLV